MKTRRDTEIIVDQISVWMPGLSGCHSAFNVIGKRAAHVNEWRTPPYLLISNAFISTKTPLN
jgi:hypothetical protein